MLRKRNFSLSVLPLLGLVFAGAFGVSDIQTSVKLIQLFGWVCFLEYVSQNYNQRQFIASSQFIVVLTIPFLLLEMLYFPPPQESVREIWGFEFTRFTLITGEHNFSATLLIATAAFFLIFKRYYWFCLAILLSFFAYSRGAAIALGVLCVLALLLKMGPKIYKRARSFLLIVLLATPIWVVSVDLWIGPDHIKRYEQCDRYTSFRCTLYSIYLNIFKENPLLGVGYSKGASEFSRSLKTYNASLEKNLHFKVSRVALEQHSLYLQVLSEFGILGYLSFLLFLFLLFRKSSEHPERLKFELPLLTCLVAYSFVNALSEYALFLSFALPLRAHRSKKLDGN